MTRHRHQVVDDSDIALLHSDWCNTSPKMPNYWFKKKEGSPLLQI